MRHPTPESKCKTVSISETVNQAPVGAGHRAPTATLVAEARELVRIEDERIDALHAAGPDEGIFNLEEVADRLTKLRNALSKVLDRLDEVQRAAN